MNKYKGNMFMIEKVLQAAEKAVTPSFDRKPMDDKDRRQAAQAKRERKMAKRAVQL